MLISCCTECSKIPITFYGGVIKPLGQEIHDMNYLHPHLRNKKTILESKLDSVLDKLQKNGGCFDCIRKQQNALDYVNDPKNAGEFN